MSYQRYTNRIDVFWCVIQKVYLFWPTWFVKIIKNQWLLIQRELFLTNFPLWELVQQKSQCQDKCFTSASPFHVGDIWSAPWPSAIGIISLLSPLANSAGTLHTIYYKINFYIFILFFGLLILIYNLISQF